MYFAKHIRKRQIIFPIVLVVGGLFVQMVTSYYITSLDINFQSKIILGFLSSVSDLLFNVGVLMLIFTKNMEHVFEKTGKSLRGITQIGRYSFGIYLFHVYVQKGIEVCGDVNIWLLKWILMSIISIAVVCLLGVSIPRKIQKLIGVI